MTDKLDEILTEVREAKYHSKTLNTKLYGENGFEGDITEIKRAIKNQGKKIRVLEIVVAGLVVSGGSALGISQLLGG